MKKVSGKKLLTFLQGSLKVRHKMLDNNAQRIRRKDKEKYHVIILANQNAVFYRASFGFLRPVVQSAQLLRIPYTGMLEIQNVA